MPRLAVLPHYPHVVDSPSPRSPSSSPAAGITSSRSVSPSSPKSPRSSFKQSAFSLVCPRSLRTPEDYLTAREMSVLMYGSTLGPLVPTGYSPYMWNHLPGLLLPCQRFGEAISPERSVITTEHRYIREVKIGELALQIMRV